MGRKKYNLLLAYITLLAYLGLSSTLGQKPSELSVGKREEQAPKGGLYRTLEYNSLNKRDPFKNLLKSKGGPKVLPIPDVRPPGIAGMLIAEVRLVGIASGINGENLAVLSGADKKAHFAYAGDRLYDGYVKQVTSDAVKFVKEIKYSSGEKKKSEILVPLYPSTQ